MTFNLRNKYFRYAFFTLLISISLIFFLLNHSLFKKNQQVQSLNDFQIETKNIHSIFIQKLKNRNVKKNLAINKVQSLTTTLSNAAVL